MKIQKFKSTLALLLSASMIALSPGGRFYEVLGATQEKTGNNVEGSPALTVPLLNTPLDSAIDDNALNAPGIEAVPENAGTSLPVQNNANAILSLTPTRDEARSQQVNPVPQSEPLIHAVKNNVLEVHPLFNDSQGQKGIEDLHKMDALFKPSNTQANSDSLGAENLASAALFDGNFSQKMDALGEEPPHLIPPSGPPTALLPSSSKSPKGVSLFYEDVLGFRKVVGPKHDATLSRLPLNAKVPEIINQISRQFHISRARVLELAANVKLNENSPVAEWEAVYLGLQRLNAKRFQHFDSQKYHASFRNIANVHYAPGWKGNLKRALEIHKHFLGFFIRFPYHLFDAFVLGYFRQNISFTFAHSTEDFLSVGESQDGALVLQIENAEKYFRKVLRDTAISGSGEGWLARSLSTVFGRSLRIFGHVAPLPLMAFLRRRLTMAIVSAIAMGVLGALAPGLAILHFSLISIPLLGHLLVLLANGVPVLAASIPIFGGIFGPIAASATQALMHDLVLGPLLNTFILSTIFTLPQALDQHRQRLEAEDPLAHLGWIQTMASAAFSRQFWKLFIKQDLKFFLGLVTVGSEIQGILSYGGQIDHMITPSWHAATGHDFHGFHSFFSAFEAPKGQSVIPFGGAITWGNLLLYKAESALGFNLSDFVMHSLNHQTAGISAMALTQAASRPSKAIPFDPNLYKKSPKEVVSRIQELEKAAGNFKEEMASARGQETQLQKELAKVKEDAASLALQSHPLSKEQSKAYADQLAALKTAREKAQWERLIRSKLAENQDAAGGAQGRNLSDLRRLEELKTQLDQVVPRGPDDRIGFAENKEVQPGMIKALIDSLNPKVAPSDATDVAGKENPDVKNISDTLDQITALRTDAQAQMSMRDATRKLLAVVAQARQQALDKRRNGQAMMGFLQGLSQVSAVMDFTLGLREINAGEQAITGMQNLLNQNVQQIQQAQALAQQNENTAQQMASQLTQWQQEVNTQTQSDTAQQNTLKADLHEAQGAVNAFTSVQGSMPTLLSLIASHEGLPANGTFDSEAQSLGTKFQGRLALLPSVANWRTNGNPSNPSAFSLKEFQSLLATVNTNLSTAQSGLSTLKTAPLESWDLIIRLAPGGPAAPASISLPDVLNARKAYWQSQLNSFQKDLNSVAAMMDPNNQTMVKDEFGRSYPQSLPVWEAQQQQVLSQSQSSLSNFTSQMDKLAAQVNQVAGTNLPMLSGLPLTQLQTAITSYATTLESIQMPNNGSTQVFDASLNLVQIANLLPQAAWQVIQASEAQATVQAIQSAVQSTLPGAQQTMNGAVGMVQAILNDVSADQAFVAQHPAGSVVPTSAEQALINRKEALLSQNIIEPLTAIQGAISKTLIPYQQASIAQVASNGVYQQLFSAENTLVQQVQQIQDKTIPWALISLGGSSGNQTASLASLQSWQSNFSSLLTTLNATKTEVDDRKNPSFNGNETIDYLKDSNYPGGGPYSLPKKIALYTTEMNQRVQQINSQAAQVNQILAKMQSIAAGKYNLTPYMLPTNITANQAGANAVNALVSNGTLQSLANELQTIASQTGPPPTITVGGGSTGVETGTQPSPTITTAQTLALQALDAAKIIAPSAGSSAQSPSLTYSMARFLLSQSTVQSSQTQLQTQIPQAETFLTNALTTLNSAMAQLKEDQAYINSGGSSPSTQKVYNDQVAMLNSLDSVLQQGIAFLDLEINTYDPQSLTTVNQVATYYNGLANQIYSAGQTVDQGNLAEMQSMQAALQKTLNGLNQTKAELSSWMSQLDNPNDSALRRTSDAISTIQDQTRAVLESNVKWHALKDTLSRSDQILEADMNRIEDKQKELVKELNNPKNPDLINRLPPDLIDKIKNLNINQEGWAMGVGSSSQASALVVKKSSFPDFINKILTTMSGGGQAGSSQDVGALTQSILSNPQNLGALIPGAQVLNMGDSADGFYLVYQTQFGVPYGLNTTDSVTLGNVAKIFGNNISVMAYDTLSPPESPATGPSNAPWGDKGVGVQVETLQWKNAVNYFEAIIHHDVLDVPSNDLFQQQAAVSRLLLFDDYALLLMNGKLYVGLTGFGDAATQNSMNEPYYYGANAKVSLKLNEVMSLDASQQELFANDPRQFFENVNLNFSGFDPTLNQNFGVTAQGANKNFSETKVGSDFNVAALLKQAGMVSKTDDNPFTVDLYVANYAGTDDINQKTLGTTVLKGFTIHNDQGQAIMKITGSATEELGQKANMAMDQLSVELPNHGIVFNADGQIMGNANDYFGQIEKKINDHSSVSVSYGSQYVGFNRNLSLSFNSSASLAQLWRDVTRNATTDLAGGAALSSYQGQMGDFLKSTKGPKDLAELRSVFEKDIGRRLIEQQIGTLSHDIKDLRSAGAIMDNTKVIGQAGFVSGPVSNNPAELAATGGFVTGTETMMTMSKTQKDLLNEKTTSLFKNGLLLQSRLVDLTKEWESDAMQIIQDRWELQLAQFQVRSAPTDVERAKAQLKEAEALERLNEAKLRYNILAGKDPGTPTPFDNLNISDVRNLVHEIRGVVSSPDRFQKIISSLDKSQLEKNLGKEPRNMMDWIPFVDQLTFGIGTQIEDMMAGQILGAGVTLRIPFHDPTSKDINKSYVFKNTADIKEMADIYSQYKLLVDNENTAAQIWDKTASRFGNELPQAAQNLNSTIQAYRNGLVSREQLDHAIDLWDLSAKNFLQSEANASVAGAWASMDRGIHGNSGIRGKGAPPASSLTLSSVDQALSLALQGPSFDALDQRKKSFDILAKADSHIMQKFWVDLTIGTDFTESGTGFLPSLGFTGFPVMPIPGARFQPQELRELQVSADKSHSAYYDALKTKLKTQTALQIYQDIVSYQTSGRVLQTLEQKVLPALQDELAQARASGNQSAISTIERKIMGAQLSHDKATLEREKAYSSLNVILGRPPHSRLDINLNADAALEQLKSLLKGQDYIKAQQTVLQSRVQVAQAYEQMVDNDLKVEEVSADPISLAARTAGRLIHALADSDVGDPNKVAAARLRTLKEERNLNSFNSNLTQAQARLESRRQVVNNEIARLSAPGRKLEPEDLVPLENLKGEKLALDATLLSIQNADLSSKQGNGNSANLPKSFLELRDRLIEKEDDSLRAPNQDKEGAPPIEAPGLDRIPPSLMARYYYAQETLGRTPLNQSFLEPWIELRLKDHDTPSEDLIALAKLSKDREDRLDQIQKERAAAQTDALLADFSANVHFMAWAKAQASGKGSSKDWNLSIQKIHEKTLAQANEIWSLLHINPQAAGTGDENQIAQNRLDLLSRLLPEDVNGSKDPKLLSDSLLKSVNNFEEMERIQNIFGMDIFGNVGKQEAFMAQIRADVMAAHMSYQGVTPIAALGIFRGTGVVGSFLQAPDPQEVEKGLENILSDSIRNELESQGKIKELELRLYTQMNDVSGGMQEVETARNLVEAAQADLKAKTWLAKQDPGSAQKQEDALDAQKNLLKAWVDLTNRSATLQSNFISLVAELKALGQKTENPAELGSVQSLKDFKLGEARPISSQSMPIPEIEKHERGLLSYWADRMEDLSFVSAQDAYLDRQQIPPGIKDFVDHQAALYRAAIKDARAVAVENFSPEERLDLLTRNDVQGKRDALLLALSALQEQIKKTDPQLGFLQADLQRQLKDKTQERQEYSQAALDLRNAYWEAVPPSPEVEAAFKALEKEHSAMVDARQNLLDTYLSTTLDDDDFLLRNPDLDHYLQAQQDFDEDLVKTLELKGVQGDVELTRTLDSLYDVHESIQRQIEFKESGRGLLALNALIMLQKAQLFAARWDGRSGGEIDQIAGALEKLEEEKSQWMQRGTQLLPLYVETQVDKDGKRVWAIDRWLTPAELDQTKDVSIDKDGRYFLKKNPTVEVVSGLDILNASKAENEKETEGDHHFAQLKERLQNNDFALDHQIPGSPIGGYGVDQLFGPSGLLNQGKVFFFEAPQDKNSEDQLHYRLPALAAWARSPNDYAVYVYTGNDVLSPDKFETLESLNASSQKDNFHQLLLSSRGAKNLQNFFEQERQKELQTGWAEMKLAGYGFARDDKGEVSEIYLNQDDFDAKEKALRDAGPGLESAQTKLDAAQARVPELLKAVNASEKSLTQATNQYNAQLKIIETPILARVKRDTPIKKGESADAYQRRIEDAVKKILVTNADYKKAQKALAVVSKAENSKRKALTLAHAQVDNATKKLSEAKALLEESKTWNLYRSNDLVLSLDKDKAIVAAQASPAYGSHAFNDILDPHAQVAIRITGPIYAAAIDSDGHLVDYYVHRSKVDHAAKKWTLKSETIQGDKTVLSADGKAINPKLRISHYEETLGTGKEAKSYLVSLNHLYLQESAKNVSRKLPFKKYWFVMPWRWGSLAMEAPREIIDFPLEIGAGRDPRFEGSMGRAYMYKMEGGSTEHHGFFRNASGTFDILNFMPDRVNRFYDLSQFPDWVQTRGQLMPGHSEASLSGLNPDDKHKDIHVGVKFLQRLLRYYREDLDAVRLRTLAHFQGGVSNMVINGMRGRGGYYEESKKTDANGEKALVTALSEKDIALAQGANGSKPITFSEQPDDVLVDRVSRTVKIDAGAAGYAAAADQIAQYSKQEEAQNEKKESSLPGLEVKGEKIDQGLIQNKSANVAVENEENRLSQELYDQNLKIGVQEEIGQRLKKDESQVLALQKELSWWDGYIQKLRKSVPENNGSGVQGPSVRHQIAAPENPLRIVWSKIILALVSVLSFFPTLFKRKKTRRNDI